MRNLTIVTTSWDDGDPKDLRVAELLHSRCLPGTFYVPINGYMGKKTLVGADLRMLLDAGFEIGAHTVSHKNLPRLNTNELVHEVSTCKQTLEQESGRKVSMFCYPNGRYDADVIRTVRNAGYDGARTTRMLSLSTKFFPFEMPTTIQAYPHSKARYVRNLVRAKSVRSLLKYAAELGRFERWVDLGKHLFEQVLTQGGIWHLYGHSWEVEELGIWDDLREMLDHVTHREGVTYAVNSQVVSLTKYPSDKENPCPAVH